MNVFILGDKYEKGMKSKGCQALIKYKNSRIIDCQIDYLNKHIKYNNIVYIAGFDHKALKSYANKKQYSKFHILYNPNHNTTNYGDSLLVGVDFLNQDCMVIYGNTLLNNVNIKAINHNQSAVFITKKKEDKKNNLGCIINQDRITNIDFDLQNAIHHDIFYISAPDTEKIKHMLLNTHSHNNFIFELINKLIDDGSTFIPIK